MKIISGYYFVMKESKVYVNLHWSVPLSELNISIFCNLVVLSVFSGTCRWLDVHANCQFLGRWPVELCSYDVREQSIL